MPWFSFELYIALALFVFLVCGVISPKFLIRRMVFGTLALVFDTFTSWLVIRAIWEPEGDISLGVLGWFIIVTPFALLGLLFTWRFAGWHQKAISN